jgi:hypothetical protein
MSDNLYPTRSSLSKKFKKEPNCQRNISFAESSNLSASNETPSSNNLNDNKITYQKTIITDTETISTDPKYIYKWCCFQPRFSSKFSDWRFTFIMLCLSCFFENILTSGVASVVLSTLEREFYLTSDSILNYK